MFPMILQTVSNMKEISGDNLPGKLDKAKYLFYNTLRGITGNVSRIRSKQFHPGELRTGKGSPGRKYLDSFLSQELPRLIPIGKIDVLDIGCGSAYSRGILTHLGYEGTYTGIDVHKHKHFDRNGTESFQSFFVESKIEDFQTDKKFDLVLSVTALEHIENDADAVFRCERLLEPDGRQIHIIPTFWSLFLYLWHGYRQYTPKRIKALFDQERCEVYKLGGLLSFLLHISFITIPVFILKTDKLRDLLLYQRLIEFCNKVDRLLPICCSLYVVVVSKQRSIK
jgi:SAM-dependent methyltransferase